MALHEEVLEESQKQVLASLGPLMSRWGFYLGGGTALAIHFGHRKSIDLDWFTGESIEDAMGLAAQVRAEGIGFEARQTARGTLHGAISGVRVSFIEYRYPLLRPTTQWPAYGCALASLDDLSCMKLSAIAQRGSRKDFVDLYVLGTRHRPLAEMLDLYRRKFGVGDVAHVLFALAYFEDAEREPPPEMLCDVGWPTMKAAIQQWVRDLAR